MFVSAAGSVSEMTEPEEVNAERFDTSNVYVIVEPGVAVAGADFTSIRSVSASRPTNVASA